jgi:hypothetical protein
MDFVQTLPTHISKQILAGLEYTKKKMPTDLVATTVDVTGPQVTPPGSPIDGQVATRSVGIFFLVYSRPARICLEMLLGRVCTKSIGRALVLR